MPLNLTLPQWDGRRGLYEVYFVIVTDPVQRVSLWLRWLLVAPHNPQGAPTVSLWAMGVFGEQHERCAYKAVQWRDTSVSPAAWQSLVMPVTANQAYVRLGDGALVADLRWQPTCGETALYPYPWMYSGQFPKAKSTSPVPRAVARGTLQWRGRTFNLTDACVSVGHFWGTQMAESWVWAQAPQVMWDDGVGTFEAFTARIGLGPLVTPPLTLAGMADAHTQRWTHPLGWARQKSHWTGTAWEVTARHGAATLEYTCTADPATIIGVTYVAPDGSRRYCYHSDLAQLRGNLRIGRTVHHFTANNVRFETVSRDPQPGLALLL